MVVGECGGEGAGRRGQAWETILMEHHGEEIVQNECLNGGHRLGRIVAGRHCKATIQFESDFGQQMHERSEIDHSFVGLFLEIGETSVILWKWLGLGLGLGLRVKV
jgi:hypothetical protein